MKKKYIHQQQFFVQHHPSHKGINMYKYVSPSWGNPTPYSKILDISGNKGRQKERMIKTRNIYSVA